MVLAVLGLITALVAPALVNRSLGSPEQRAVVEIRDALAAARLEAVRSTTPVDARLVIEEGVLTLQWGGNTTRWPGVGISMAPAGGPSGGDIGMRFDAHGRSDQRGVRFLDESAGTMWEISFDAVTGRPVLREPEEPED